MRTHTLTRTLAHYPNLPNVANIKSPCLIVINDSDCIILKQIFEWTVFWRCCVSIHSFIFSYAMHFLTEFRFAIFFFCPRSFYVIFDLIFTISLNFKHNFCIIAMQIDVWLFDRFHRHQQHSIRLFVLISTHI